ncbi:MAG: hypothetical protein CK425_08895 [Parachlamydia sp.]|nr:MAG: hypothetical protein CK425_08895 [Parachlamydia sp.]
MKRTSDANSKINYDYKKFEAKNHALNSAAATAFLALGWIPIIGGALGVISGQRILKHKKSYSLETELKSVKALYKTRRVPWN